MGLLSALFGSRGTAVAADHAWLPVSQYPEEFLGDDADVDDNDQALSWCAKVTYENLAAPDAWIIASVYVAYTPGSADYLIGLRYRYISEADPGWTYLGHEDDPEGEVFDHAGDAQADARDWARSLAGEDGHSREQIPDVFDWDGEPFDPEGD